MAGTSRGIHGNFDKCHVKWIETDKVQCQVYQQEYMAILINTRYMKMDRSYQSSIRYDQEITCTSSAEKDGNFINTMQMKIDKSSQRSMCGISAAKDGNSDKC